MRSDHSADLRGSLDEDAFLDAVNNGRRPAFSEDIQEEHRDIVPLPVEMLNFSETFKDITSIPSASYFEDGFADIMPRSYTPDIISRSYSPAISRQSHSPISIPEDLLTPKGALNVTSTKNNKKKKKKEETTSKSKSKAKTTSKSKTKTKTKSKRRKWRRSLRLRLL